MYLIFSEKWWRNEYPFFLAPSLCFLWVAHSFKNKEPECAQRKGERAKEKEKKKIKYAVFSEDDNKIMKALIDLSFLSVVDSYFLS